MIQPGVGGGLDMDKGLAFHPLDVCNRGYRVARREASAQARGYQYVPGLDICIVRQVGYLQPIDIAGAHGNRPLAGAQNLYWQ